jgi:putative ABC transport system substrate-binding protein
LVGLQPDIILTWGTLATASVQRETRTIPSVFVGVGDPVVSGTVPRLNRPGENITGFALYEATLTGKWLELLSEIAPSLMRAAIMFNPDIRAARAASAPDIRAASPYMSSFEMAARSLKVVPIRAPVHGDVEIETAIIALGRELGGGLVVISDAFTTSHRAAIISAAARNNVPAVYALSEFVRDGEIKRFRLF